MSEDELIFNFLTKCYPIQKLRHLRRFDEMKPKFRRTIRVGRYVHAISFDDEAQKAIADLTVILSKVFHLKVVDAHLEVLNHYNFKSLPLDTKFLR